MFFPTVVIDQLHGYVRNCGLVRKKNFGTSARCSCKWKSAEYNEQSATSQSFLQFSGCESAAKSPESHKKLMSF